MAQCGIRQQELTSPKHASVSQGQICLDSCTCCHTETEAADQICCLTQSRCTNNTHTQTHTHTHRGLRNFLSTDKPEHHSIDRLKERGVEKGSGRHSTLQGRERSVFNQTNIGTVSRATLGRLLRDGAERVWAFPSATMPS